MLKRKEEDFLEWEKITEGLWTKRRKHQVLYYIVVYIYIYDDDHITHRIIGTLKVAVWENKILLMGEFDGESVFDLNVGRN